LHKRFIPALSEGIMARTAGSDGKKTRAAIHAKAQELIVRHSYEALTMRQLADAVGLQAGALYHYYPSKQALLLALIEAHLSTALEAAAALPDAGEAPARLTAFARFHVLHGVENRQANHVANNELRSLSRENFAAVMKLRAAYDKKLRSILKDGAEAGNFEMQDAQVTGAALVAMLNEVIVWFREGGKFTLDETAETYARMALKMVSSA
jgi:AcrR family transcriptional regulator